MTATAQTIKTIQMYRVYIKATPQAIWDAITKPEWTKKYGYAPLVEYDLRAGGKFHAYPNEGMKQVPGVPDVILDGEVVEAIPRRKLVQTWRMLMDPGLAAEGFTRLTHEIEEARGGVTKLTVTHDVTGAPNLAALIAGERESGGAGGGCNEILSGLKTLLETRRAVAVPKRSAAGMRAGGGGPSRQQGSGLKGTWRTGAASQTCTALRERRRSCADSARRALGCDLDRRQAENWRTRRW